MRSAQRLRGLFELLFQVFQHRLHGAHDKRQADERQRDQNTQRRERDLDPHFGERLSQPAIGGINGGERDTCDRSGQRKWQIDQRIDDALAGKPVAHQHPRDQQSEHRVDCGGH